MVMAHTLVQRLAAKYEALELHVVAPPATASLATRMPQVSVVHRLDIGHGEVKLGTRARLARRLRRYQFDQAWVLPNSFKSALVPWLAGVNARSGWLGEGRYLLLNDARRLAAQRYPLMIERFLALADEPGAPLAKPYPQPQLAVDSQRQQELLASLELPGADDVVALCPGAEFGPAKRWPARHFAQLASSLIERGQQIWLMGSAAELSACEEIVETLPAAQRARAHTLAGRTQLLDALDLLALARQVVCNDSGLMHMACAVGTPTVAVYGSTSPSFTPPLAANASVVSLELDCSPCFARNCPLGHLDCLQKLEPERVLRWL